jgi:hypothetical protein
MRLMYAVVNFVTLMSQWALRRTPGYLPAVKTTEFVDSTTFLSSPQIRGKRRSFDAASRNLPYISVAEIRIMSGGPIESL